MYPAWASDGAPGIIPAIEECFPRSGPLPGAPETLFDYRITSSYRRQPTVGLA
jgi:hypothetical protein